MSKKPGDSGQWWKDQWNFFTGCTRISEACDHCYALGMLNHYQGQKEGDLRFYPERMDLPLKQRKPRRYFVGNMTDIFHPDHNYESLLEAFRVMCQATRHTFMLLTKRPERAVDCVKSAESWVDLRPAAFWPISRIWFGITAENQQRLDERGPWLLQIPAAVRFISFEPLLGPVMIPPEVLEGIHWVIVGGENGPGARPMRPEWVRSLRYQCQEAGIPFWFKHWGSYWKRHELYYPGNRRYYQRFGLLCDYPRLLDNREWSELPMEGNNV